VSEWIAVRLSRVIFEIRLSIRSDSTGLVSDLRHAPGTTLKTIRSRPNCDHALAAGGAIGHNGESHPALQCVRAAQIGTREERLLLPQTGDVLIGTF
jgi:hypothetical protein